MKDKLFVLKPGFKEGSASFFCSECAMVEGMLSFYPALRDIVDVEYVSFERPRKTIVDALGEAHQGAPVLVLADNASRTLPPGVKVVETATGKRIVDQPFEICEALAALHGTDRPH